MFDNQTLTKFKNFCFTQLVQLREEPRERCGFILQDDSIIECNNIARDPVNDFKIDSTEAALTLENRPLCLWHNHCLESHPDLLTPSDISLSQRLKIPFLMFHSQNITFDYYEPNNPNPFPLNTFSFLPNWEKTPKSIKFYEGWQSNNLLWGRTDCFALIRCFFLGILGIDIGNFQRPDFKNFPQPGWKTPWVAEENGFYIVDEIKQYDVLELCLNGGRNSDHLAVVVDARQGLMLHQPGFGHLSKINKLGKFWRDRISVCELTGRRRILRHSSLESRN